MDELNERRCEHCSLAQWAARGVQTREEHNQCGAHTLASIVENILQDVVEIAALRVECIAKEEFILGHLCGKRSLDIVECHIGFVSHIGMKFGTKLFKTNANIVIFHKIFVSL